MPRAGRSPGGSLARVAALLIAAAALVLSLASPAGARETRDSAQGNADWPAVIDRVSEAVVVLRVSAPRSFDTGGAAGSVATGFVIDAKRGLILTNRHVVMPGPVVAEAVFLNHEEVPVRAVYRDPVHDFGFFQFDPAAVKFMQTRELPLVPEHAKVGTEVRVVGNDAGEKLSILTGTIARLDRQAPEYGRGRYNDFNTFYYQAASSTSGGSSGSPVVDRHGHVVALNAGGSRRASSSFYLPLDRVVRALDFVRAGQPVPRGTVQTVFRYRPYDELRRLGLRASVEESVRKLFPDRTGMLVVDEIVPEGPAEGLLEPGDVLVGVAGEYVTDFPSLEEVFDDAVGESVLLLIERGGESLGIELPVQDLHSITPAEYLEVGGAVVHPLSYQVARGFTVPVRGLYLATSGYVFSQADVSAGVVLTAVDGQPVATLSELEALLVRHPDGARLPVRYVELTDPTNEAIAVITLDRRWFPMQRCRRADVGAPEEGSWPCTASPPPPPPQPPEPATTRFPDSGNKPERNLAPSLVMVTFGIPYRVDAVPGERFRGTGLVVDAERGLVVVDRETVPAALGDVRLTFASSVEIPGEFVYLHPAHGLAVVSYDPALLGDTRVLSAKLRTQPLRAGDSVYLVGLSSREEVVSRQTNVARIEAPVLPLTSPPRFRETNIELIALADSTPTLGGVLADKKGRVQAFWASFSTQGEKGPQAFFAGIPAARVAEMLERMGPNGDGVWRSLGAELTNITLATARRLGLSDALAQQVERRDDERRSLLAVSRLTAATPSAELLRPGDLLLSIEGELVTDFDAVERAAQAERVRVEVLRDGEVQTLEIPTAAQSGRGTERALLWAGALLQTPHISVARQRGIAPEGVYVAWLWYGSPANRYGLTATRRIVAVDGVPTPDLDAFIAQVANRPDRGPVRLHTIDLDGKKQVLTLKLDLAFWPTSELRRGEQGWERIAR